LAHEGAGTVHVTQASLNLSQAEDNLGPLVPSIGLSIVLSCRLQHPQLGITPCEICSDSRLVAVRQKLTKVPRGPAISTDASPRLTLPPVVLLRRQANQPIAARCVQDAAKNPNVRKGAVPVFRGARHGSPSNARHQPRPRSDRRLHTGVRRLPPASFHCAARPR